MQNVARRGITLSMKYTLSHNIPYNFLIILKNKILNKVFFL